MFTVYVNGILSRPGTRLKNALSNTVFCHGAWLNAQWLQLLAHCVKVLALAVMMRIHCMEVPTMLASTSTAVKNGWELMSHAFVNGVPKGWSDPTKIARQQSRLEFVQLQS